MTIGNEENMAKIREMKAMAVADEVNTGTKARNEVYIDYTSGFGTEYKGTIVFKRPSVSDFMRMGALKAEVLRQAGVRDVQLVDDSVKMTAQIIATLKVVMVKKPEWLLNIDDIEEMDLLFHVFGKYEEWERSFRRQPEGNTAEGNSEASK